MSRFRLIITTLIFSALSSSAIAQDDESAWNLSLDSIVVKAHRFNSPIKIDRSGATIWSMTNIQEMPQILSNADPISYARMLPGIQTNNEYYSGLNMDGCDNQHNAITLQGVQIYNPNHLLGFFSTFNSAHFKSMDVSKSIWAAESPNRLGGTLNMEHALERTDSCIHASISVGMISSQGNISIPIGKKSELSVAARISYLNFLYSDFIEFEERDLEYSFGDVNASFLHRFDDQNTLLVDFYAGKDKAYFNDANYLTDISASWGNTMGAAHWYYDSDSVHIKTSAFVTSYRNNVNLTMRDISYRMPSRITDFGVRSTGEIKSWSFGIESTLHKIEPQNLEHISGFNNDYAEAIHQTAVESSLFVTYSYKVNDNFTIIPGLRASLFNNNSTNYGAIDPSLRLSLSNADAYIATSYALRHQYLSQTGFTDFGMPTEFWIASDSNLKPQYAHSFTIEGGTYIANRSYRIGAEVFYKRLYHQVAYSGSVVDYVNTTYDLHRNMIYGNGKNYGFSVSLNKCSGKLNGWISYAYTHARRRFDRLSKEDNYPTNHERPHEFNAVATYELNKHWSFGGTFVYASGTPFTAAESVYLLNNNLVIKKGEYNGARLRPYVRLNLSANYKWKSGKSNEHCINLSVYNATGSSNDLFYYLSVNDNNEFKYKPMTFAINIMPSISYTYKF